MSVSRSARCIFTASAAVVSCLASRALCQKSGSTDPLDCAVPACADMTSMFKKSLKGIENNKKNHGSARAVSAESSSIPGVPGEYVGCPVDRNELGVSSWVLLHTMAANYPENPTVEQQQRMMDFIAALALFYPCVHCAQDFQTSVKQSPPRVASRKELVLWMCELHNEVNVKLGMPTFPCELTALDERWRVSRRKECWPRREVAGDTSAKLEVENAQS